MHGEKEEVGGVGGGHPANFQRNIKQKKIEKKKRDIQESKRIVGVCLQGKTIKGVAVRGGGSAFSTTRGSAKFTKKQGKLIPSLKKARERRNAREKSLAGWGRRGGRSGRKGHQ